jgi:large subunit ribosomal protein L15
MQPNNLDASGADLVYSQALLAVIGALALEQGSAVANRMARERILLPLGLKEGINEKLSNPQQS